MINDKNTGNGNRGNGNIGWYNVGDNNIGWCNVGDNNVGNWNAGNGNTGHFNRDTPATIRVFEKPCSRECWDNSEKPDFFYFHMVEFVKFCDMTEDEKEADPGRETIGGYLRKYEYKEAFKRSWDEATEEDRAKLFRLPNFDSRIFMEISGIDVTEETDPKQKELKAIRKQMEELRERMEELEK